MTVETLPKLCSQADVERLLSVAGVIAFSDHEGQLVEDPDVLDDSIEQASGEILLYLANRYDPDALTESILVRRWATVGAAFYLCQTRNNPPPESLAGQWERLIADPDGIIPKIGRGALRLAGVEMRYDSRPAFSNLRVDRRWPTSKVRVTRVNSSDAPTELTQKHAQPWVGHDY